MKNIKHIFFDLDNTLWDYRRNAKITLEKLYEEFQIEKTYGFSFEEFHPFYHESNESLWAGLRDQKVTKEDLRARRFPEAFQNMGIENPEFALDFEERFVDEVTDSNHIVEGTEEILNYLKDKYTLHILSNGFEEVTYRKIENSIISNYIETISTAEGAGAPKPDPKAFQTALDISKASREESLYVGDDWIADMVGATRFGMKAIFFNPLDETHDWIPDVPIIDKLIELKNYL